MVAPRCNPIVVLLVLAGVGAAGAGCSDGTTPVCDDAGSCLIVPPGGGGGDDGGSPETGSGDDGPRE